MNRFSLFLPDYQTDALRRLADQTHLPIAELVRRVFDQALNADALNDLIPAMSGQLLLAERVGK